MKPRSWLAVLVTGVSAQLTMGAQSPDDVIAAFLQAVGGKAAVERTTTREIHAHRGHDKVVYYWQKPDNVLLVDGKKKIGYDGGSGWTLSSKKRVTKLSKGEEKPLLMDADPLRYVRLKQLYSDLALGKPETLDNRAMDVLIAPNNRGQTKFYFDHATHLLAHIEETGETSAYYKHETDFEEYREQDGVKLPFRITHDSNEPGGHAVAVRYTKVIQNEPLDAKMFVRPSGSAVVLGGKR